MTIQLINGAITLPANSKVTVADYETCINNLPLALGKDMGSAVSILNKDNREAACRFIGEMKIAGYLNAITYFTKKNVKVTDIHPTAKLKAIMDVVVAETKAIEPVTTFKGKAATIEVRRGVDSRNKKFKQDKKSFDVVKEIRKQKFTINEFMLEVVSTIKPEPKQGKEFNEFMFARSKKYANELKGSEFMFPYYLDSRGRIYVSTTVGISPQGSDYEKALLLPTHKETLTEGGFAALVEAALGYAEQDWSVDQMVAHANSWKVDLSWRQADKPYCYLALAKMIAEYVANPEAPLAAFIPLDARCSGLQHWSAITRSTSVVDRLGMSEVAAEDGLDMYQFVAAKWGNTLPEEQQFMATRKAAKVPTMTFCYNATHMTSIEHLRKTFGKGVEAPYGALGVSLYKSLHTTLESFSEAVEWLRGCAKVIGSNSATINWTTDDGFVGQQTKFKTEKLRLRPVLSDGSQMDVVVKVKTKEAAPLKHASALAPNLIHSTDSCHLRAVARRMSEAGMPMVFIHDSFATHVNNRDAMYDIITEEFIKMYADKDVLGKLHSEWTEAYGVELPTPPAVGMYDVRVLANCSEFFN